MCYIISTNILFLNMI